MNKPKALAKNRRPPWHHVQIYFDQKGFSEAEAHRFFDHYDQRSWTTKTGAAVKNWKAAALEWIWQVLQSSSYQRGKSKS
jgi:mannosyltransferase OCH1-like enzyme